MFSLLKIIREREKKAWTKARRPQTYSMFRECKLHRSRGHVSFCSLLCLYSATVPWKWEKQVIQHVDAQSESRSGECTVVHTKDICRKTAPKSWQQCLLRVSEQQRPCVQHEGKESLVSGGSNLRVLSCSLCKTNWRARERFMLRWCWLGPRFC